MNMTKNFTKPFLLLLVLFVLIGCYLVFRPFLTEIFVAIILVSIFYRPYEFLVRRFKGRKNFAALLMCFILVLMIVLPALKGIIYAGQKSVIAYSQAVEFFNKNDIGNIFDDSSFGDGTLKYLNLDELSEKNEHLKSFFLDILKRSSNWLISGATMAVKGTTNFIVSLVMIIIAMFFFFIDGKKMLEKLMYLSPLPDKYDKEIFHKFRSVSYTTFVSTFFVAAIQGVAGAIGFAIVGFPALLAGVLIALFSLIPYIGSIIFYVPVGIYYILIGSVWQGIFILCWGALIVGSVDDLLRAYLIKGKAEVNLIFVLFSILGGISLFGFWGIVLGPLIVALTVTILHIYELEFCNQLEGNNIEDKITEIKKEDESDKLKKLDNNDIIKRIIKYIKKKN
jgi:predicted PurR-regulated permease PerM